MSVAEMSLSLFAAEKGYLKDIEINKILDFEAALISFANSEYSALMTEINETGNYNAEIEAQLKELLEKCKSTQTW
jgi:F-type H+-transporting ATPase subunit alpha